MSGVVNIRSCFVNVNYEQTDVTKLIGACLNLFILVVPGKKKESAWLYTFMV